MKRALSFDSELVGPWVCKRIGCKWVPDGGSVIGKLVDGKLVAGVIYQDFNGANIGAHIAGEGNWADRVFLAVIFDYPFNQIGTKRITAPVCSTNTKSIDLLTKMGFNLEAKLHGATSKGDLLLFSMFKNECKYLRGNYGKYIQTAAISTSNA